MLSPKPETTKIAVVMHIIMRCTKNSESTSEMGSVATG